MQNALDESNETVIVDIAAVTNGTELGTQPDTTTITAKLSAISGRNVIADLAYSGTATLTALQGTLDQAAEIVN